MTFSLPPEQRTALRLESLALYGVTPRVQFNPEVAVRQRIDYLKSVIRQTGQSGFVLGISGGVDSSTAGRLCQLACEELRREGTAAFFTAMRLPADVQADEHDAQAALSFIQPDRTVTVNIGPASTAIHQQAVAEFIRPSIQPLLPSTADFHKGNVKARMRMLAQYEMAGLYQSLVVGTDHSTEGICGFYTKFGDGACDLLVLNGLNKTQVRACAQFLGAPESLYRKVATADLEELAPQKTDEDALGLSYDVIDLFLEGELIDPDQEERLLLQFQKTQHKRQPPLVFQT